MLIIQQPQNLLIKFDSKRSPPTSPVTTQSKWTGAQSAAGMQAFTSSVRSQESDSDLAFYPKSAPKL